MGEWGWTGGGGGGERGDEEGSSGGGEGGGNRFIGLSSAFAFAVLILRGMTVKGTR